MRAGLGLYSLQFWKEVQGSMYRAAPCFSLKLIAIAGPSQSQEPFVTSLSVCWSWTLMASGMVSLLHGSAQILPIFLPFPFRSLSLPHPQLAEPQ